MLDNFYVHWFIYDQIVVTYMQSRPEPLTQRNWWLFDMEYNNGIRWILYHWNVRGRLCLVVSIFRCLNCFSSLQSLIYYSSTPLPELAIHIQTRPLIFLTAEIKELVLPLSSIVIWPVLGVLFSVWHGFLSSHKFFCSWGFSRISLELVWAFSSV